MARYDTLGWQNENALSSYPFTFDIFQQDLLVDARFVQFDDFLPILNSVVVNPDNLIFEISFDFGVKTGITLLKKVYALGPAYRSVRIYTPDGSRYLGVITVGIGAEVLWDNYVGRKFTPTAAFCTDTVRSVPSRDAVYLFDSNYGDIELGRTAGDKTIFYNVSLDLNSITFNAVTGHSVDGLQPQGLRRINLVPAFNNNINLASNDVIKFTALNNNSLDVSLVSGTSSGTFALPTLIA